jgi:hypothetical protein
MVTFTEPFRANFRVTFLLGCGEASADAVVATDPVSVNADYDKGTAVSHQGEG